MNVALTMEAAQKPATTSMVDSFVRVTIPEQRCLMTTRPVFVSGIEILKYMLVNFCHVN